MAEPNEPLSEREEEILRLVATGAANKEIARQLVISPNTVKVHLRNIFTKIGVTSRTEATLYAMQIGLVTPTPPPPEKLDSSISSSQALADEDSSIFSQAERAEKETDFSFPATTKDLPEPPSVSRGKSRRWLWIGAALLALLSIVLLIQFRPSSSPQPMAATLTVQSVVEERWSPHAALPDGRKGMGIVEYENRFYVFGGQTAQGVDGAALQYDPGGNTWQMLSSKPTAVTEVQAALIGEKIYVPGGLLPNGNATDQLEVFNPRENTWETKAALPAPLSAYTLVTFEGDLYLLGGRNGDAYLSTVYHYDPSTDQWDTRSSMSAPRAYAGAVVDGAKIILMGGFNGKQALTSNEAYFPSREGSGDAVWEDLPALPEARYGMGATLLTNQIYLLGGFGSNRQQANPAGLQFNLQTNQWSQFNLPENALVAFPALIDSGNFLYLIGGESPAGISKENQSYQAMYTISVPILQNGSNSTP